MDHVGESHEQENRVYIYIYIYIYIASGEYVYELNSTQDEYKV